MTPTPQHSPELEASALGAVMMSPTVLYTLRDKLADSDYHTHAHRVIWQAMCAVADKGLAVDYVTIGEHLKRVTGDTMAKQLSEVSNACATSVTIDDVADQLADLGAQRRVLAAAQRIATEAGTPQSDIKGSIIDSIKTLSDAADRMLETDVHRLGHGIMDVIDIGMGHADKAIRVKTGIPAIDNGPGGVPTELMTVVGGRPGMGKSSLALCVAKHVAQYAPVLIYSLEDRLLSWQTRLTSHLCGVPYRDIERGMVPADRAQDLTKSVAKVNELPIYVCRRRLSSDEIARKTLAFSGRTGKPGLVVVDHLGKIRKYRSSMSDYEARSHDANRLSELAEQVSAPVLVLCQLNRRVEGRDIKVPGLSDLRDSGKIEEDARMVILLYRGAVYNDGEDPHDMQIIIAKDSQGVTGTYNEWCDLTTCRVGG